MTDTFEADYNRAPEKGRQRQRLLRRAGRARISESLRTSWSCATMLKAGRTSCWILANNGRRSFSNCVNVNNYPSAHEAIRQLRATGSAALTHLLVTAQA